MVIKKRTERLTRLWRKIDRWVKHPKERPAIKNEIWERWGTDKAVLITDLSSFSHLTRKYGIIHFLSLIRMSHTLYLPIIRRFRGKLIKIIADDLVVYFSSPQMAVHAAVEMQRATRKYNARTSKFFRIGLGVGIEYGKVLLIDDIDLYGDPVNIASKLGEDVAERDSILVGLAASSEYCAKFPERSPLFIPKSMKVSNVDFSYYQLDWKKM